MKRVLMMFLAVMAFMPMAAQKMMKPGIIVVPGDAWCNANGYMQTIDGQQYPDYRKALMSDKDLINVISRINLVMSDRGFPLLNLETALKNMKTENIERKLYTDRDGAPIKESPLDQLYRAASADIILQLSWGVNKLGPKYSGTISLQALDSYTTKQIAGCTGTGRASFTSDVPTLIDEALVSELDTFCSRLLEHFEDAWEKGREVSLDVLISKNMSDDFSTEYEDDELSEVITGIVARNAKEHSFGKGPCTDTMMQFHSVRMPVVDENGIPADAYSFARKIMKPVKKAPYNLTYKVISKGLGKAVIILGED